jgi:hypothetical protein
LSYQPFEYRERRPFRIREGKTSSGAQPVMLGRPHQIPAVLRTRLTARMI